MSRRSSSPSIKDIVVKKVTETSLIAQGALLSGGWIYPLHGILYFASHPALYRSVAGTLYSSIIMSVSVVLGMFVFTYLPQAAFCALFAGPLGFIAAVPLVLGESYAIVTGISKVFYLGRIQDEIFDAVMLQQGHEELVSRGRQLSRSSGHKGVLKLGSSIMKPLNRFSKEGVVRYLVSLPLNAIPIMGTVFFLLYNGIKAGPSFHARYFQLKGLDKSAREKFVERWTGHYTGFGAMALALNLVPAAGLVFGLTSTVGAALWASDLEKKERGGGGGSNGAVPKTQEEHVEL